MALGGRGGDPPKSSEHLLGRSQSTRSGRNGFSKSVYKRFSRGLYQNIKAFADFTEKLTITNSFAEKLEWTFAGLFSVVYLRDNQSSCSRPYLRVALTPCIRTGPVPAFAGSEVSSDLVLGKGNLPDFDRVVFTN